MEAAQSSRRSLGELFVERGLISQDELDRALAEQYATNQRLADILVRRGLVTGHDITSALMEQMRERDNPDAARPEPAYSVEALHVVEAEVHIPSDPEPEPASEPELEPPAAVRQAALALVEAPVDADAVVREAEARRRAAESRLEALNATGQGLDRVRDELEAQALVTPSLVDELEAAQQRLRARERALAEEIADLQRAGEEIARRSSELDGLRSELAGKLDDLSEVQATAAIWNSRVAELEADVTSLTDRIDAGTRALATLVDDGLAGEPQDAPPAGSFDAA